MKRKPESKFLCIAAEMGHTSVVRTLIEAAANIEVVGEEGATPLILAATMDSTQW